MKKIIKTTMLIFLFAAFFYTLFYHPNMANGGEKTGPPIINYSKSIDAAASGLPLSDLILDIFIDKSKNELFILDDGNQRVVITDLKGIFLYQFTYRLNEEVAQRSYTNITVRDNGDIYMSSVNRIDVFNYRGRYKRTVDLSVIPVDIRSFLIQSIFFDNISRRLYIGATNHETGKVFALDTDEKFLFQIGDGQFINAVAVNVHKDGIYILDPSSASVFRLNMEGKVISRFGQLASTPGGFSMPADMIVDDEGFIRVVDVNRVVVIFFDKDGEFIAEFGNPRLFSYPRLLEFSSVEKMLYVVDQSGKIRVFRIAERASSIESQGKKPSVPPTPSAPPSPAHEPPKGEAP